MSEFGVAAFQGLFGVVTRFQVGVAAEAALFKLGSDFGRPRLVSRCSSGNPINDGLSGIVWFLHRFHWFLHGVRSSDRERPRVTSRQRSKGIAEEATGSIIVRASSGYTPQTRGSASV